MRDRAGRPHLAAAGCARYHTHMNPITSNDLLTRDEAAEVLRVSLTTMSRIIGSGRLPHLRIGRAVRIPREALDAYVRGEYDNTMGDPMAQPEVGTWPPTPSLLDGDAK